MSFSVLMRVALRLRDWLLSLLSALLLFLLVFWTSAFLYGSFHWCYMPKETISMPVHFTFKPCEETSGKCSWLFADLSLDGSDRGGHEQHRLAAGQSYRVSLEMDLPPTDTGMFLTCVTIKNKEGTPLSERCRSALPPKRGPSRQLVEAALMTPFYLTGIAADFDRVAVGLFEDYVEDYRNPVHMVHLELRSRFVDVDRATFRVHAHFSGLRHIMYHHPLLSSLFGICSIATVVFTLIYFCWRRFFEPNVVVQVGPGPLTFEERQQRARNFLNRSRSQQQLIRRAVEETMRKSETTPSLSEVQELQETTPNNHACADEGISFLASDLKGEETSLRMRKKEEKS